MPRGLRFTVFLIGFSLFSFLIFVRDGQAAFMGEVPTGIYHSEEDLWGYSVYVPENYSADRIWPLVVAFHDIGGDGKTYIQEWIDWAERRGMIVVCPTYEEPRDIPYDLDKRNLRIVKSIVERYEIDPNRILLAGTGFGGHYAVYLGLKHPHYFSTAVASIGNGFRGAFSKVLSFSYAQTNQPVFLILSDQQESDFDAAAEKQIQFFRKKGYSIEIVGVDTLDAEKTPGLYPYILEWFDEVAASRQREMKSSRGFKESLFRMIDTIT